MTIHTDMNGDGLATSGSIGSIIAVVAVCLLIWFCVHRKNKLNHDVTFPVRINSAECYTSCVLHGFFNLVVKDSSICLRTPNSNSLVHAWPCHHIRKYGSTDNRFFLQAGHMSESGQGMFVFQTKSSDVIVTHLKDMLSRYAKERSAKDNSAREEPITSDNIYSVISDVGRDNQRTPAPRYEAVIEQRDLEMCDVTNERMENTMNKDRNSPICDYEEPETFEDISSFNLNHGNSFDSVRHIMLSGDIGNSDYIPPTATDYTVV